MSRKPAADSLARALDRAEGLLARLEALLPPVPAEPDWSARAFRWRKRGERGFLQAVMRPQAIHLEDLVAIDEQKRAIDANTRQFVAGLSANNVLLTGSRGTGKSSLVKAMLAKNACQVCAPNIANDSAARIITVIDAAAIARHRPVAIRKIGTSRPYCGL